jgi:hypothetical protein
MDTFITEYGRTMISVIAVAIFLILFGILISSDESPLSLKNIFSKNAQNSEAINKNYDSIIGDTIASDTAPYFEIDDNIDLSIEQNTLTYNDLIQYVRAKCWAYDRENNKMDYIYITTASEVELVKDKKEPVTLTILAYKYEPVLSEDGHSIVMEEVTATDKYGHTLIVTDGNGKEKTTTILQPKYNVTGPVVLNESSYIDTSATNCQIKVVYRVQVGTYKAECEVTYLKNEKLEDSNTDTENKEKMNIVKFETE